MQNQNTQNISLELYAPRPHLTNTYQAVWDVLYCHGAIDEQTAIPEARIRKYIPATDYGATKKLTRHQTYKAITNAVTNGWVRRIPGPGHGRNSNKYCLASRAEFYPKRSQVLGRPVTDVKTKAPSLLSVQVQRALDINADVSPVPEPEPVAKPKRKRTVAVPKLDPVPYKPKTKNKTKRNDAKRLLLAYAAGVVTQSVLTMLALAIFGA